MSRVIILVLEGVNAVVGIIANTGRLGNETYWNYAVFTIFFLGFAVMLLYDKRFKQEAKESIYNRLKKDIEDMKLYDKAPMQEGSLDIVSQQDKQFIMSLSSDMLYQHGHMDIDGLLADRASGIALNGLMLRKCNRCNIPRNQRGGTI